MPQQQRVLLPPRRVPQAAKDAEQTSTLMQVLEMLGRPSGAVAGSLRADPNLDSKQRAGIFMDNLLGKRHDTWSQNLALAGMEPGYLRSGLGFAGDVALDPLNLVGTPIAKAAGKLVSAPLMAGAKAVGLDVAAQAAAHSLATSRVGQFATGVKDALGEKFVPYYGLDAVDALDNSGTNFKRVRREFDVRASTIPEKVKEEILASHAQFKPQDWQNVPTLLDTGKVSTGSEELARKHWQQAFEGIKNKEDALGLHRPGNTIQNYMPIVKRDKFGTAYIEATRPQGKVSAKLGFAKKRTSPDFATAVANGADPSIISAGFTRLAKGEQAVHTADFLEDVLKKFGTTTSGPNAVKLSRDILAEKPFWERTVGVAGQPGQTAALKDLFVDPRIKKDIERLFAGDQRGTLGKSLDWYTNKFRGLATVYKPSLSFPLTNLQGNFWNAALGGQNPLKSVGPILSDIVGHNTGKQSMRLAMDKIPGMTEQEVRQSIKDLGISNPMTTTVGELNAQNVEKELIHRLVPWQQRMKQNGVLKEVASNYPVAMRNFNSSIEEASKTKFFLDKLKEYSHLPTGERTWKAYEDTAKYLFNYQELTDFERKLRRFVPFYTFSRKSLPLQLEGLAKHPSMMATPGKLKHELEDSTSSTDGLVPEGFRPEWMQKQGMIQIPSIFDPEKGTKQFFNPYLPIQDLNKIPSFGGTSVPESLQELGSMLNPVIKAPIELATNKSLFSNRPIWDEQLGPSDLQPAIWPLSMVPQSATPMTPFMGTVRNSRGHKQVEAEAWLNYVLGNVNPLLSSVGRSFNALAGNEGAQRLDPLNALTGIRISERDRLQLMKDQLAATKLGKSTNNKQLKQQDLSEKDFQLWLDTILRGRK